MKVSEFYENKLKNNEKFHKFVHLFLEDILPNSIDIEIYKNSAIDYLFYDKIDFLYQLKYQIFRQVNSEYLVKLFKTFQTENAKWVDFVWDSCKNEDKSIVKDILVLLGNKKVEVLQTITLPSFKSFENDVQNSDIVTKMLNSIVIHLQELQKNQNMMLANISHEMRTPLNSVIGYLDVLDNSTKINPEDKKNILYAKNSSKLLLTLINDLLDTQKLASSTLDLTNNPFWLNRIIKNAVLISSINANQKHIEFNYTDKISIFNEVEGDKNRFLQILNNLFSNAVKFTPEHGKIYIEAVSEDLGDSVKLRVCVKDNGIGIVKEKQKELFKPFSRATNKEKGTGLGLYISKQLANRMGGDIWFESEENKGSTFYVEVVFKKSKNIYDKEMLKNRKIIILKNEHSQYCSNLIKSLAKMSVKIKIFNDENKFMQFLMFNKDIDMAMIVYPHKIERDDLDLSFIKTYKKINENNEINTNFTAVVGEEYYPKNIEVFDKVVHMPVTTLDIIESLSTIKTSKINYRYLIIDDEPMNRMVLSTMIKTFDSEPFIDTANDGVAGLEKIKHNKYDVIFLDKRMPKMDGYEVLEEVKKLGLKVNIYLLTADGDNETIEKTKEYNVGYISKPVGLSTLKSIVSNISGDDLIDTKGYK